MWVTIKSEAVPQGVFELSYLIGHSANESPYKLEYVGHDAIKKIHVGYYSFKFLALLAMKKDAEY